MRASRTTVTALLLGLLALAAGCDGDDSAAARVNEPLPFAHGDECHVCGMLVVDFPGPKGEAFEKGRSGSRKFCSTRDLFAYLLQPETGAVVREVYVHDMEEGAWHAPDDAALVDARRAWYVAGQPLRGAMGPTLASFARAEAAEAFAERHGGTLLRYEGVTLELIGTLDYGEGGRQTAAAPRH